MAGSTPIYGFPYPQSTDLVADYPTLGQELATDVETVISGLGSGLNMVTPTSISNTGGTATLSGGAVTATGCTALSLNGIFTATYSNYLISFVGNGSARQQLGMRFRAAGTDASGASDYRYAPFYWDSISGSGIGANVSNGTSLTYLGLLSTTTTAIQVEIYKPQIAVATIMLNKNANLNNASNNLETLHSSGYHSQAVSYDGISFLPQSAASMTGIIRVYGYKNS